MMIEYFERDFPIDFLIAFGTFIFIGFIISKFNVWWETSSARNWWDKKAQKLLGEKR